MAAAVAVAFQPVLACTVLRRFGGTAYTGMRGGAGGTGRRNIPKVSRRGPVQESKSTEDRVRGREGGWIAAAPTARIASSFANDAMTFRPDPRPCKPWRRRQREQNLWPAVESP